MKRWLQGLSVCMALLALSSCSLLPVEEELRAAPLIREYEREEFQLAFVERGDMTLSASVYCTYVPVQTEGLSYSVGGVYYDETFVQVGSSVKKGQLLAQLDMAGVQELLDQCTRQIEETEMRLGFVEENRQIALEKCRLTMKGSAPQAVEQALEEVNEQYDGQVQSLNDALYLLRLHLKEYEKQRDDRQLRANFDGTVTYVRQYNPGDRSVASERMITIADSALSLFRAETEHWEHFQPGQEYVITAGKSEYEAVVASEEELGLKAVEKKPGERASVYFVLKTPSFDLEDGDRGKVTLILDERTDVLMVPDSAVTTAGGQSIVYYQDEQGMKAYKPIKTGLVAEHMVEVLEGLTEGESVIVE